MKRADAETITKHYIPSLVLMERASLSFTEALLREFPEAGRFLVVCGSGNNGGDGICIARLLKLRGLFAAVLLAGDPHKLTQETETQLRAALSYGVPVLEPLREKPEGKLVIPDFRTDQGKCVSPEDFDVVIDAVFGVGLSRSIEGDYRDLISIMNSLPGHKAAVDIPSGIDADTGQVLGIAFRSDLTVTFAFTKPGLILYPGRVLCGKRITADIGISLPDETKGERHYQAMEDADLVRLPRRDPGGNKGSFGKVLVIAGSKGMCGAAYLCAKAALSAGAGMVMILTPEENRVPLQAMFPEAMVETEETEAAFRRVYDWCDVVAAGPGLGRGEGAAEKLHWFLRENKEGLKPFVLDADGLNLLAEHPEWEEYLGSHVTVTPHPGEMARISACPISQVLEDPVETAAAYAGEHRTLCVLKGACTVTSDGRDVFLNESGNDGMATAGSGDVLSGLIAGFLAQDPAPSRLKKTALYVYVHGRCGDAAAERYGKASLTAGRLIEALPEVMKGMT